MKTFNSENGKVNVPEVEFNKLSAEHSCKTLYGCGYKLAVFQKDAYAPHFGFDENVCVGFIETSALGYRNVRAWKKSQTK